MSQSDQPLNLGGVLFAGMLARCEDDRRKTWEERGRLRGGSVGLVLEDGTPISGCPRAAYARFLGSEPPRDEATWALKHLMLDFGNDSEGRWASDLKRGLIAMGHDDLAVHENPDGTNDFHVEWFAPDPRAPKVEVRATGREDVAIVKRDAAGAVELFCELKQVSSMSTAATVLLQRKPKLDHTTQSANYALRQGVPVQLWYVNRVNIPFPPWNWLDPVKYGPVDGEPRLEPFLERTGKTQRSKLKQILPFLIGYQIGWTEDGFATVQALLVDGPLGGEWETPVNRERIDRHYDAVLAQERDRKLHPIRPVATDADGNVHGRFDPCNWCEWKANCDANEDDFDAWRESVLAQARKT